jgi:lipopolysaccharide export system protein LptC
VSEAATKERAVKQHWAEPGSRHDKVVRATKFGLPILIGGLAALLAIAPFDKRDDVSFILDKNTVDQAQERMRVEKARYTGEDNKGQKFLIIADRAVQPTSNVPVVAIEGMRAQLNLGKGPLSIVALRGRYDLEQERVLVDGPVRIVGSGGYQLTTRDVTVDLDKRSLSSDGPVSGSMELGQFQAGQLKADLDERTVSLEKGVRLKIYQGAVRLAA